MPSGWWASCAPSVSIGVIAVVGLGFYAVSPCLRGLGAGAQRGHPAAVRVGGHPFVVGLTLQYGDSAEVFSWGTLVLLMPLSGVFYPVESLPAVLQPIATVIPLTKVFSAVQQGLATGTVAWAQLAYAATGTAVALGLAVWFLDRQMRRFRALGWVTRFT